MTRKILCLALALCMALGLLAGCSGSGSQSTTAATTAAATTAAATTAAGTTAADDQNIVCDITLLDFFRYVPAIPGEVRSRCQDDTGCRCAFDEGTTRNFP